MAAYADILGWICSVRGKSSGGFFSVEFVRNVYDLRRLSHYYGIMLYNLAYYENPSDLAAK